MLYTILLILAVLWACAGGLVGLDLAFGRKFKTLSYIVESKGDWAITYLVVSLFMVAYTDSTGKALLFSILITGFLAPVFGFVVVTRFGTRPLG